MINPYSRQRRQEWWLHELSGQRHCRQHFSTLQTTSGLRAVGVGSGTARAEASDHRLSCTAVQALWAAARGPTLSRPHAGCTQGACMLGGLILAYSAHSARISRPLVMACPPCGTRSDRRWHAFAASLLRSLIELRPTRVCRMSETRLRVLKSVL